MRAPTFVAALGVLGIVLAAGTGLAVTEGPAYSDAPAAAPAAAAPRPAPLADDPLAGVVIAPRDAAAEAAWDATEAKAKAKAGPSARVAYFGQPWVDVDGNGCRTDDDIARRDLVDWTPAGRCDVTGGHLTGYEGQRVENLPGRKQLDHVVALHRVYTGGGAYLSQADRVRVANDPDNLIYTDARSNSSKGDDTASEYLPPDPAQRCRYVVTYVVVVKRYGLAVTPADADALRGALARC